MKRISVLALAASAVIATAVTVGTGLMPAPVGSAAVEPGRSPPTEAISPPPPADAVALTVLYVYDGDTIQAQVQAVPAADDVVTTTEPFRIRIIGIDTPEVGHRSTSAATSSGTPGDAVEATPRSAPGDIREAPSEPQCWSAEARAHLGALLPEGATVRAAPDRETWDDYGRRLLNVWTSDGRFVAGELVRAGDAEAIRIWPNVTHFDVLRSLEHDAREAGHGQWGSCVS